ncbi:MAG: T9SS type A sorting domain-containing protein, partial [Bacteroidia bacterium]|nr:T9SS type A sorting domain-containing protein [Bacteroidia bacterium]
DIDYSPWTNTNIDVDPSMDFDLDSSALHIAKMPPGIQYDENDNNVDNTEINEALFYAADGGNIYMHGNSLDYQFQDVVFDENNKTVTLSAWHMQDSVVINSLTMNCTNCILKLEGDIPFVVKSTLDLTNGRIILKGKTHLKLLPTATILNGNNNSYVITDSTAKLFQIVDNTNKHFPVGGLLSYAPVVLNNAGTIDFLGVSAMDSVTDYIGQVGPPGGKFMSEMVNKTWMVGEETIGGSNVTMTMKWYASDELPGFDRTQSRIRHFTGGLWQDQGMSPATFDGTFYNCTVSGINSFSPHAVWDDFTPMPVELVTFTAQQVGSDVVINWQTAHETNSDRFIVERSFDNQHFAAIGTRQAAGYSSEIQTYNLTDRDVTNLDIKRIFYRLRSVDLSGQFTLSPVIEVLLTDEGELLAVFPNPTYDKLYVSLKDGMEGTITIQDIRGRILQTVELKSSTSLDLSGLKAGTYLLTFKAKDGSQRTIRVLKQ